MSTHSEHSSHSRVSTFLFALLLVLAAILLMGQTVARQDATSVTTSIDEAVDGKEVFDRVCATCHTVQPPPNLAPPMAMVVRHYRMELTDSVAIRNALVSWIGSPDSTKSLLPAHAIERFGLMAPVALSAEEIESVVDYVMTLEPAAGGMGMKSGSMMGQGSGMMGRQMGQDSTMQGRMKMNGMMGQGGGMKQNGMMGRSMMQADSTAAAATCQAMNASAAAMNCGRMDSSAAGMNCMRMDSSAAAMNCGRMDSTAGRMNCARTGNAAQTPCPRVQTDSMSTAKRCSNSKAAGQTCKMRH